jgi:hypothetical protein
MWHASQSANVVGSYCLVFERKDAQPLKRWVEHFGYAAAP